MHRFVTATIVGLFLLAVQLLFSSASWAAEARLRADADWEAVVKAEGEGQLAIYANTSFEAIFPEFRKRVKKGDKSK